MSGEPSFERIERALTAAERRWLRLQLAGLDCRNFRGRRALFATAVVCGPLWIATLLVDRGAHALLATVVWLAVAVVVNVFALGSEWRSTTQRRRLVQAALRRDHAIETRVVPGRLLRIEEMEDCGDCWLFEIGEHETLVLQGQHFYETERFPSAEFSLVEIKREDGDTFHSRIVCRGEKLSAQRTFPAAAFGVVELEWPDTILRRNLRDLEAELAGASIDGRYR